MRLKTRCFYLIVVFILSLAMISGCSGKNSAKKGEKVIKIGFIGPLSGNIKNFGESSKNAFNLAIEQTGGIIGDYKIETVIMDDHNDPVEALNAANKLINQEKVKAIICSGTPTTTLPVSQAANNNKVVVVASTATNPKITVDNNIRKDFVFRACFIDPFQGTVAAKFALDTIKAKTAAIFHDQGSDYSTGLANYFKDNFIKAGGEVLLVVAYEQEEEDFSEALSSIIKLNPDIIYLPDFFQKASFISRQAREKGIRAIFLGSDAWDYGDSGYESLEGGYFTNHYSAEDPRPEVKKWVELYRSRFGIVPEAKATLCYDATSLLLNAIKTANIDDPDKIKEALQATKDFPSVSGKISLDKEGNPIKPAAVLQIKGSKLVYVSTVTP